MFFLFSFSFFYKIRAQEDRVRPAQEGGLPLVEEGMWWRKSVGG
jgi:hypothetical protein